MRLKALLNNGQIDYFRVEVSQVEVVRCIA